MSKHHDREKYTTVRITRDTHAALVVEKGKIESATGQQASVNTVITKLVKEHNEGA